MILDKIAEFNPIYIQLHDNPDADAIASGFGLYSYFTEALNKDAIIMYGGRNKIQKTNLIYMLEHMEIDVTHVTSDTLPVITEDTSSSPILVTVDCQYGARNVTKFDCENIAIIDHHQMEIENIKDSLILPKYDACATIVWKLLTEKGFNITDEKHLGTALYYGIFTDTNLFTEMQNPTDRDAVDSLPHNARTIDFLKNSNISLDEMEISANALRDYIYDEEHCFAVSRADKCDPNILGLISDFLLQVDRVNACVVFSDIGNGLKFSVRSCVREVDASELASYIADDLGSGGGHLDKAGGFISPSLLEKKYPDLTEDMYFTLRLQQYFSQFDIIYADKFHAVLDAFKMYSKRDINVGFVKMTDVAPVNTPITCRTMEGDLDLTITDDLIVMIGIKGEVYPNHESKFHKSNRIVSDDYDYSSCVISPDYVPTVHDRTTGKSYDLTTYAHTCASTGNVTVYAQPIERAVKVFTSWDPDRYMQGKPGDYIAVRSDDLHDVYIIERNIFAKTYKEIGE